MDHNVLAFPLSGDGESIAVVSYMVLCNRREGRIVLIMAPPRITDIHIKRIAEAVELPDAGNGHIRPSRIVEFAFPEVCLTDVGVLNPFKLPYSVDGHVVGALLRSRYFVVFVGKEICVHRRAVDFIDCRINPFCKILSRGRKG